MIDKFVYINSAKKLFANSRQLKKIIADPNKELHFLLSCEQKLIDLLKEKKNQINEDLCNKLLPVVSIPRQPCGPAKAHEKVIDDFSTNSVKYRDTHVQVSSFYT